MEYTEQWVTYLRRRQRAASTIATYKSTLDQYVTAVHDPFTATLEDAEQWWASLDPLSVRTRTKKLASIRSFYKWAMRFDHVTRDPTRRIDPPNLPKGAPRYITRDQLNTLLDQLPADLRRAVVLGAWAGLRVSEAAALTWADIDTEAHRIHVRHGKGDKSRAVGAHPLLLDALLPDTGGNVITGTESAYSADSLQRRANRAMARLGVEATFHQLRHRFGTMTYGATGDPLAVAAAMGHASLETTRIYAAVSDDALDRVATAAVR